MAKDKEIVEKLHPLLPEGFKLTKIEDRSAYLHLQLENERARKRARISSSLLNHTHIELYIQKIGRGLNSLTFNMRINTKILKKGGGDTSVQTLVSSGLPSF